MSNLLSVLSLQCSSIPPGDQQLPQVVWLPWVSFILKGLAVCPNREKYWFRVWVCFTCPRMLSQDHCLVLERVHDPQTWKPTQQSKSLTLVSRRRCHFELMGTEQGGHGEPRWPIWVSLDTSSPSCECVHSATPTWPDKGMTSRAQIPQVNYKDLPRRLWTRCILIKLWRRETTSPCCRLETKWNYTPVFHPPNYHLLIYPAERGVPGTGERPQMQVEKWVCAAQRGNYGSCEGELLWSPFQRKSALIVHGDNPSGYPVGSVTALTWRPCSSWTPAGLW